MIKNCLFAAALLSLALACGCAKGGNGVGSGITVTVGDSNIPAIYPNQHVTFTATVSGTTNQTVTWSLSGTGSECTGAGNPCGTLDKNTGAYVAPTAPPSPATVTITATSAADSTATGTLTVHVVLIAVTVTPTTVIVGQNLVQQFTAIAVPDDAPQTFAWTCTPSGSCGTLNIPDPNVSGVAVYTAPASNLAVVVAATSTVQQSPAVVGQAKVQVVSSRMAAGTYAFRFSGYDSSGNPVAVAGSLAAGANGTIISGVEDVVINGVYQQYTKVSGSYVPSANNSNDISNNLGTLTLSASGGPTYKYTAVLTSSGIFRMIESDSTGIAGSGVMQRAAANTVFNAGAQTFAFGFTGVDSSGKRVGYVGLLPMTPSGAGGTIAGGLLDSNDNGITTSVCAAPPCSVTGTYQLDATISGLWHLTLSSGATTLNFDFFVSAGQTNNQPLPLTLYAVSKDSTYRALSGSVVYQWPMTYNNAAFNGTSVSNLTGTNANVSLTLGTTDGTSGGTGGTGGFTGSFDQNDHGTIVSVPQTKTFAYTYAATGTTIGRYIFQMLGDPTKNPVVTPIPFVLYASGANRGFLLDQSNTPAVMTGTMYPQPPKAGYTPTELPGTYASATISNSDSSILPVVQNLLLTSTGGATYNVAGTQTPPNQTLSGKYTMTGTGVGAITLTAPLPPTAATNAIYAIGFDSSDSVITDFMMIGTTSGTSSSIMFAQQ